MTVGAGGWGRCVNEDLLAVYRTEELVATGAGDIAVLALQGELGPLVMIEQGRFPLSRVVAVAALRDLVREQFGELAAMDIFVALLALFRCLLEVHIHELGFHVGRLVAVDTGDRAVRTSQRK